MNYPDGVLTLRPPDGFTTILDGPHPIYRCSSVDSANRRFLRKLQLKTVLHLVLEEPPKPLVAFTSPSATRSEPPTPALSRQPSASRISTLATAGANHSGHPSPSTTPAPVIPPAAPQTDAPPPPKLIHLGQYALQSWETFTPTAKRAIEKTLSHLTLAHRPALIVDGGNGVFVGVLRKLMGWNHTSIVLEYRANASGGAGARYADEEFLEGVRVAEVKMPEGVRLTAHAEGEDEEEEEEEEGTVNGQKENGDGERKRGRSGRVVDGKVVWVE